jgi:hypothetical protein
MRNDQVMGNVREIQLDAKGREQSMQNGRQKTSKISSHGQCAGHAVRCKRKGAKYTKWSSENF